MSRRYQFWTAKAAAYVRVRWGKDTCAAIGAAVGRKAADVWNLAASLGLPQLKPRGVTCRNRAAITRLAMRGETAAAIGKRFGIHHSTVTRALLKWKVAVPAHLRAEKCRETIRLGRASFARSQGCRSWGEVQRVLNVRAAIELGWPYAGTAVRARICAFVHQAGRPVKAAEILALMPEWPGRRMRKVSAIRSTLRRMKLAGLVAQVTRGRYVIGPAATGRNVA